MAVDSASSVAVHLSPVSVSRSLGRHGRRQVDYKTLKELFYVSADRLAGMAVDRPTSRRSQFAAVSADRLAGMAVDKALLFSSSTMASGVSRSLGRHGRRQTTSGQFREAAEVSADRLAGMAVDYTRYADDLAFS